MTTGEQAPDPREARNPAEYIARLQELKDWSGLTYRELSARAEAGGDVLPRSTVANMLARTTVPREELLACFVRACGVAPAQAETWETVRAELATRGRYAPPANAGPAGGEHEGAGGGGAGEVAGARGAAEDAGVGATGEVAGAGGASGVVGASGVSRPGGVGAGRAAGVGGVAEDTVAAVGGPAGSPTVGLPADGRPTAGRPTAGPPAGRADPPPAWPADAAQAPGEDPEPGPPSRLRRAVVGAVAVAGLVLATVSVVAFVRDDPRPGHAHRPVLTAPAEGPVRIRVIGSDLCLNERRGNRDGQIYQRACAGADVPRYELKRLGGDQWRLVSVHPDFPVGCSGIPSGGRIPYAALEDSECGDPTRVERFTLEPHGSPVAGYRIVPAGSATPGSCVTVVGDRMAEWSRLTQAPCTADARGQLFSFDRR